MLAPVAPVVLVVLAGPAGPAGRLMQRPMLPATQQFLMPVGVLEDPAVQAVLLETQEILAQLETPARLVLVEIQGHKEIRV